MLRSFPVILTSALGVIFASLIAGFMLASWTVSGISPAYAAPPRLAAAEEPQIVAPDNGWREAGYERIGLWEQPRPTPEDRF